MIRSGVIRDWTPLSKMADKENTNMEADKETNKSFSNNTMSIFDEVIQRIGNQNNVEHKTDVGENCATAEYCEKLQAWMWQYYTGYVNWQSWLAASAMAYPYCLQSGNSTSMPPLDLNSQTWFTSSVGLSLSPYPAVAATPSNRGGEAAAGAAAPTQPQQQPQDNGNAQRPGKTCKLQLFTHILEATLDKSLFLKNKSARVC